MNKAAQAKAEARRADIVEALDSLSATELLSLYRAIQQVRQGDKAAVQRLTDQIRQETEELEQALLSGYRPDEFKQLLTEGLKANGGEA